MAISYNRRRPSYRRRSSKRRSSRRRRSSSRRSYGSRVGYGWGQRDTAATQGCRARRSIYECSSDPNCQWQRNRGCIRQEGVTKGAVYQGPMLPVGGKKKRKSKSKRKSSKKRRSSKRKHGGKRKSKSKRRSSKRKSSKRKH